MGLFDKFKSKKLEKTTGDSQSDFVSRLSSVNALDEPLSHYQSTSQNITVEEKSEKIYVEDDFDSLLETAIKIVIESGQASTSLLQRRLKVGYARAGALIDDMEQFGIVGSHQGSKPRSILINYGEWLQKRKQLFNTDRPPIIIDISTLESRIVDSSQNTQLSIANEIDLIDKMNGYDFELFCCTLLEKNGFVNVCQTQLSGDNGIDIIAEKNDVKYGIQCKCYSDKLGNKCVQETYTGLAMYDCDVGAVLTNNYFTDSAIATAKKTRIRLWDRNYLIALINNVHK